MEAENSENDYAGISENGGLPWVPESSGVRSTFENEFTYDINSFVVVCDDDGEGEASDSI